MKFSFFGCRFLAGAAFLGLLLSACSPDNSSESAQVRKSPEDLMTIVQQSGAPSEEPASWKDHPPTEEARQAWMQEQVVRLKNAAKAAKELYQLYPDHPRAEDARNLELEFLERSFQMGGIPELDALIAAFESRLKQENLARDQAFELSAHLMEARAQKKEPEGKQAVLDGYHEGLIQLAEDFPEFEDSFRLMMSIAPLVSNEKAEQLARKVLESEATGELLKAKAKGFLIRFEMLGKPMDLELATLDGSPLKLSDLKGKVVLLDFWATWCQPCLQALPEVLDLHGKAHDRGFEIVGISLDTNQAALERMIQERKMSWPQVCDNKGWEGPLVEKLGVDVIPTMWLLDRQGVLRDIKAHEKLEEKVLHLLSEQIQP